MQTHKIKNFNRLSITPERKTLLKLAETALLAIDTESAVKKNVSLKNGILKIGKKQFTLSHIDRVFVIGFGKSSSSAALALEQILQNYITDGVVVSLEKAPCKIIRCYEGTHPLPSMQNVVAAEEMAKMTSDLTKKDLVINLISGGGSALLCWDKEELLACTKAYNDFLTVGQNINELNLVRKHLSKAKGGGLAQMLYPANVISLIFSDVPGNHFPSVASGPTYPPTTNMYEAKTILEKYGFSGYKLLPHPDDKNYFKNVYNYPVVSNLTALDKMKEKAEELGFSVKILTDEFYGQAEELLELIRKNAKKNTVLLAGTEIKVVVTKKDGNGGRCQYLGMAALCDFLQDGETLLSLATDGLDNSDCAGVIVDHGSYKRAENLKLSPKDYLENFKGYDFFEALGSEQIFTGPTGANVSDLLIFFKS